MKKGRGRKNSKGEIQEILGRIYLLALDNVHSDTHVYHITHSAHVQFILCQIHSSELLHIIMEMTKEEHKDSEMLHT